MDYDRCLPAVSAQRYYDTWYPYPASALPAFPVRDQQDYPSPAPSCSDPSPASRSQPVIDSYTPQTASDFPLTPFSQLDSSIGPLRSTRRHTSLRQSAHHRRLSLSSAILREQDPSVRDAFSFLVIISFLIDRTATVCWTPAPRRPAPANRVPSHSLR